MLHQDDWVGSCIVSRLETVSPKRCRGISGFSGYTSISYGSGVIITFLSGKLFVALTAIELFDRQPILVLTVVREQHCLCILVHNTRGPVLSRITGVFAYRRRYYHVEDCGCIQVLLAPFYLFICQDKDNHSMEYVDDRFLAAIILTKYIKRKASPVGRRSSSPRR